MSYRKRTRPHGYSEDDFWDMMDEFAKQVVKSVDPLPRQTITGARGIEFDIKPPSGPITKGRKKGLLSIYKNFNDNTGEIDFAGTLNSMYYGKHKISTRILCQELGRPYPKDGNIKKISPEEMEKRRKENERLARQAELEKERGFRNSALITTVRSLVAQLEVHRAKEHAKNMLDPMYSRSVYQKFKTVDQHPYPRKKNMQDLRDAYIIHPKEPTLREIAQFCSNEFQHPVIQTYKKDGFYEFKSKEILDAMDDYDTYINNMNRTNGVMITGMHTISDDVIRNIQMITHEKNRKGIDKFFIRESDKSHTMTVFNKASLNQDTKFIFVTEGYATGESFSQALKDPSKPVVVAWDRTNLPNIMNGLASKYPDANLIIVADNDHKHFHDPKKKLDAGVVVSNPGLKDAITYVANTPDSIRQRVGIIAPTVDFTKPENKMCSDFNDVYIDMGYDTMRRMVVDQAKQLLERRENNVCEASHWKDYYNSQISHFREVLNEPRLATLDIDIVATAEPSRPLVETPKSKKMSDIENSNSQPQTDAPQAQTPKTEAAVKQVGPVVEMPSQSPINQRESKNVLDMINSITDDQLQLIKPKSILESAVVVDAPVFEKPRYQGYSKARSQAVQAVSEPEVKTPENKQPEVQKPSSPQTANTPSREEKVAEIKAQANQTTAENVYIDMTKAPANAPANQTLIDPALMTKLLVRSIEMKRAIDTIEALHSCDIPLNDKSEALSIASGIDYKSAQKVVIAMLDPVMAPHVRKEFEQMMEKSQDLPIFNDLKTIHKMMDTHTIIMNKNDIETIQLNQKILSKVFDGTVSSNDGEYKQAAIQGINEAIQTTSALRYDRREKGIMYRSVLDNFSSIKDDPSWVKDIIQEFNKVKSAIEERNNAIHPTKNLNASPKNDHNNQPSL